jgi:hypothetical protein
MYRSVLTSLTMLSLALIAVRSSAQQPSPTTGPPSRAQPTGVVQQQDCPKLIAEINAAAAVRFDPVAANAKQVAANVAKLQAEGRYQECFLTAQSTRDLLASSTASAVYPEIDDPRAWAHPDEDIKWVRRQQGP